MTRTESVVMACGVVLAAHLVGCSRTLEPDSLAGNDPAGTTLIGPSGKTMAKGERSRDEGLAPAPLAHDFLPIHWSDFVYEGCFLIPPNFTLVPGKIAYLPLADQLAMNGVRFGIPQPVDSRVVADLNTASWDGVMNSAGFGALWDPVDRVSGMVWEPETQLVWVTGNEFYNVAARNNLGVCATTADFSGAIGAWRVADPDGSFSFDGMIWTDYGHANQTHGYVLLIPKSWSDIYTPGKRLGAGYHRTAGAFGGVQGPVLWAFRADPTVPPGDPASPTLPGHDLGGQLIFGHRNTFVGDGTSYRKDDSYELIWVCTPDEERQALLVGCRKGLGPDYYGQHTGGCTYNNSKGWFSHPYEPQLHFVDVNELGEVARGDRAPWDVQAYETAYPTEFWKYTISNPNWNPNCREDWFGGMAFDQAGGRLFVCERRAFDVVGTGGLKRPVIHVWRLF